MEGAARLRWLWFGVMSRYKNSTIFAALSLYQGSHFFSHQLDRCPSKLPYAIALRIRTRKCQPDWMLLSIVYRSIDNAGTEPKIHVCTRFSFGSMQNPWRHAKQ